jgi:hypothetical protein
MTRLATTVDRLAALVFGLAMIAIGAGLLVWNTNWIPHTPEVITAPELVSASQTDWWPWVVAAVGLLLVLVALRWLLTHTPKSRVKQLRLVVGEAGTVTADIGDVASAAARALEASTDAHSARGRAVIDRGVRTIDLTVTAQTPNSLTGLIAAVDDVGAKTAGVLGDAMRTTLHVDRHTRRNRVV